jgi:hypothetical protein
MLLPRLLSLAVLGADLTPREAAVIELEQARAAQAIAARHGDRTPGEQSNEERRAQLEERAEAEREILDRHGVSLKAWVLSQVHRDRAAQEAVKRERAALLEDEVARAREQEEARAAARRAEAEAQAPVTIERGVEAPEGEAAADGQAPAPEAPERAAPTAASRPAPRTARGARSP